VSRLGLLLIGVLVAGGLLGTLILHDPGYVLVSYADTAFETSLWFALLMLIGLYLAVRAVFWTVRSTRHGFGAVLGAGGKRRVGRSQRNTDKGLLLWAEGDWRESQRLLADSAADAEHPFINHLFAANSAQHLGDTAARDRHLAHALSAEPAGEFALTLIKSGYLMESGAQAEALSLLKLLRARAPRHPLVASRLVDSAEHAGEWDLALDVLGSPSLRDVLTTEEIAVRTHAIWRSRLQKEDADAVWQAMPKSLQQAPQMVQSYAERLIAERRDDHAEAVIRTGLRHAWSGSLVRLYSGLVPSDAQLQIGHAESWLKKHENDPDLLLALGRMHLRAGALEKAENYLKARLRLSPDADLYADLGRLYVERGDLSRATDYLLQALSPVEATTPLEAEP